MTHRNALLGLTLALGCARTLKPEVAARAPSAVLELARARPVADPLQARFSMKVRSRVLQVAGSTHGALIVDRPGQGHFALMGPVGGPIFTLSSDGQGVSVLLPRDGRHLVASDADRVLDEVGGGLLGVDDLFGLLLGVLPLEEARITRKTPLPEGRVQVTLAGPEATRLVVTLRTTDGTPESLAVYGDAHAPLLVAAYSTFESGDDGSLLPTAVAVEVPRLDLRLELAYRSWKVPDPVPDVFGLGAPSGFRTESLEHAVRELATRLPEPAASGE